MDLTSLTIPNSVVIIDYYALFDCTNLANVVLGSGVNYLVSGAFSGCRVTNVILGNSVSRIGASAFYRCTNVTSVTFPASVTRIEDGAFFACDRLTNCVRTARLASPANLCFDC